MLTLYLITVVSYSLEDRRSFTYVFQKRKSGNRFYEALCKHDRRHGVLFAELYN